MLASNLCLVICPENNTLRKVHVPTESEALGADQKPTADWSQAQLASAQLAEREPPCWHTHLWERRIKGVLFQTRVWGWFMTEHCCTIGETTQQDCLPSLLFLQGVACWEIAPVSSYPGLSVLGIWVPNAKVHLISPFGSQAKSDPPG